MGALLSTTMHMSTLDNIPKIITTHALLSLFTQDVAANIPTSPPQMSYSSMSRTGAVPKQKKSPKAAVKNACPDHLRNIMAHHMQGSRTLIFVRGAPGSGKSYLAREIVAMTVGSASREYKTHIFSTDDFFTTRGKYLHDKSRLVDAHLWNQNRVRGALKQGLSPVIVDNTNIQLWEMLPYLQDGLYNGYIVEVVEPNTPWAKIANQLFRRNIHNVPMATIRKMLEKFVPNVTGASLLQHFGLTYPPDMIPPVLRRIPRVKGSTPEMVLEEKIILEHAEIALQMELKENELAEAGKEPEVPDIKEIMDMDFALSLYQKNVAEWQNKAPNDMAAKMTRDKLYNLFPDISQDVLLELLIAHDNNFQATVEVLLMSTGRADIVQEKDGVNKFIMKKELERQEKLLEEEKKALREIEWPLLPRGEGEKANMEMVESYRTEARKHLARRNLNLEKAKEYTRKGMTPDATSCSEMASYHQQRFEQANSMAAVTLVQVHARNRDDKATIDLHYLHVAEAKESLDLFLDTHIQKLKEDTSRPRYQVLFFITGRGLHSHGKPRIKPAVKKRLKQRGLQCKEKNPGLLQSRVCADSKLSYELGPA